MSYGAEKYFLPFRKRFDPGCEDDFIGEQVGEDEMDRESDSEEDSILRIDPSSSDEHSEYDEPSITTLQPLDMAFLSREVEGGVSTGSDNRDMLPSSSPAPTSSFCLLQHILTYPATSMCITNPKMAMCGARMHLNPQKLLQGIYLDHQSGRS